MDVAASLCAGDVLKFSRAYCGFCSRVFYSTCARIVKPEAFVQVKVVCSQAEVVSIHLISALKFLF